MKSFSELDQKELYRSAIEDFAVDVSEEDGKKVILAALLEAGIEWKDYLDQHPEFAEPGDAPENVITSPVIPGESQKPEPDPKPTPEPVPSQESMVIRVKEEPVARPNEKYLVKMVRDNPLFEILGYRFTREHPYALVSPEDAQHILSKEVGFRQALPAELDEFYG